MLGADSLVVVSSAMVYGAIANNPIPLTEEAVLRPDPTFVYARQLASAEALVEEWRTARPGRRTAVLRPAIPLAADGTSSLARALTAGLGHRFGEADPGAQFVHHDDVASAVALAVERRLDGIYNVAPDGSIPGDRVRALSGRRFRLPLPDADRRSASARCGGASSAARSRPGCGSYTRSPVDGRQRQAARRRVATDGLERAGLRRGHRGQVVFDGDAEAASGDRARRR